MKAATFGQLVKQYLVECPQWLRPRTIKEYERYLTGPAVKSLAGRTIRRVDGRHLSQVIEGYKANGHAGAAKNCRAAFSAFLTYCVGQEFIDRSPLPTVRNKSTSRNNKG